MVNSENIFEVYGLCSLCEHGFFTSKAMFRQFLMFCYKKKKAMCRPAAAGKNDHM